MRRTCQEGEFKMSRGAAYNLWKITVKRGPTVAAELQRKSMVLPIRMMNEIV
jgi:hypothetical protein